MARITTNLNRLPLEVAREHQRANAPRPWTCDCLACETVRQARRRPCTDVADATSAWEFGSHNLVWCGIYVLDFKLTEDGRMLIQIEHPELADVAIEVWFPATVADLEIERLGPN